MIAACPICKTQVDTGRLARSHYPLIRDDSDFSVDVFDGACASCGKAIALAYYPFNGCIVAWSRGFELESTPESLGVNASGGTALYAHENIDRARCVFDRFKTMFHKRPYLITRSGNRELVRLARLSHTPVVVFSESLFEYSDAYQIPCVFVERIIAGLARDAYAAGDTYLPSFKRFKIDNSTD